MELLGTSAALVRRVFIFMHSSINLNYRRRARVGGYALTEVLVCVFIMMVVYGGAVLAYVQTCKRAEWSGLSLSAQGLGVRQLEQARAAKWDTQAATAVDLVTNVAGQASLALDLPIQGTNVYYATNYTTVGTLTLKTNTGMAVHFVRVDTVWMTGNKVFTNTIATYRGPNQ
ncbi:MAG: hypothetical protein RL380_242 [Verrucomicrobiota bacterium]